MKLDVPTGTTFYWNPYRPKFYTNDQSPTLDNSSTITSRCSSSVGGCSDDEGSFGFPPTSPP